MLPVKKPDAPYRTLEDIRLRKEQLYTELQQDQSQFSNMWGSLFVKRENTTKAEFISGVIANSITAVDAFLLVRKLMKNYNALFRRKRR